MAETFNKVALSEVPQSEFMSLHKQPTRKVNVVKFFELAVDAAPSDTTLYTVPTGKTFFLTGYNAQKTDAGGTNPVYDSAGDSASGSAKITIVESIYATQLANQVIYDPPIPFYKGLTLKGTEMTASKTLVIQLAGYYL